MSKISVTILTGFLGSGKTTLLNHLLSQDLAQGSAVIVNEFGKVNIDAKLVVGVDEEILEINNGCICCTVRSDLVSTIGGLLERQHPVSRILIETTGLADPAPIIQSFVLDERLREMTELDAVVTVVDALHLGTWLELGETDEKVGRENIPSEQIAFADLLLLNKTDLLDEEGLRLCEARLRGINPLARIRRMCNGLIEAGDVLGLAAFDLRNALRLEPELLADQAHEHAQDIASVVVRPRRDLDAGRFFPWIDRFVRTHGRDVLRIKGIVAIAGERRRYVFHGVHMTLDGRPGRPWEPLEDRAGEIVFIGRNLDRHDLDAELAGCLAEPLPA